MTQHVISDIQEDMNQQLYKIMEEDINLRMERICLLEFTRDVFKFAKSCSGEEFLSYVKKYEEQLQGTIWNTLRTKNKDTIAHFAAQSGCLEILKYLLEHEKIVLEAVNRDKKTPLHVAAQASHFNCVDFLLLCGVQVDPLKKGDWTPLMLACTKPDMYVIERLLLFRAKASYKNKDGWTPFHIACREGNSVAIRELLDYDSRLWKTRSFNLRTPLHTAALHGRTTTVEILLVRGRYKADEKDVCGYTPLMDAGAANCVDVMKLLIKKHKASCEEINVLSRNVLHLAAQSGAFDSIKFLVNECKMNINAKTDDGLTPLHFAARENNVTCMHLLISLGAFSHMTDGKGRTASQYLNRGYLQNDTSKSDTPTYHDVLPSYNPFKRADTTRSSSYESSCFNKLTDCDRSTRPELPDYPPGRFDVPKFRDAFTNCEKTNSEIQFESVDISGYLKPFTWYKA